MESSEVFNSEKSYIKRTNTGVCFTDIVVQIPSNAKSIDELPKTTAPDDRYELFEEYTIGIWRYKRTEKNEFNWEEAEQLCKQSRDTMQPVPIRLYVSSGKSFIPEYIVQYL